MATYKVESALDSTTSKDVQEDILRLLLEDSNIVLDMTHCSYVSSAGLRVLLYTYKVCASQNKKMYLVGVSTEIREVMSVTGFEHYFKFYDSVDECIP